MRDSSIGGAMHIFKQGQQKTLPQAANLAGCHLDQV